ncbi:unnamed protein product [Trifolium pratense]|uniref:Uncharacterized protein n=1 Tax=Trifolium pratense TaxID=57577 RepID=A0ACB0J7H2_TRIPR|nr:unnamed protein product [Trifolium pratense]
MFAFKSRETSASIFDKVTVTIINNVTIDSNFTSIEVHCKSKDDDLGFHTLKFGESYTFSFKRTLLPFKTTLFYCSFTWPGDSKLHYLDIFNGDDACDHCNWKISTLGGCKYLTETQSFSKCYYWNKS